MRWIARRALASLAVLAMPLTVLAAVAGIAAPAANAATGDYLDASGNTQTAPNPTVLNNTVGALTDGGWYVCDSSFTYPGTITVTGDVVLILDAGCDMTVNGAANHAGIEVPAGASVTIYAGAAGPGQLTANGGTDGAGIGGGQGADAGSIMIAGGTINATGGNGAANGNGGGAGIGGGGGNAVAGGAGGTITITGGTITAVGGNGYNNNSGSGAGIGGGGGGNHGAGGSGGTITIIGGTVNASGGSDIISNSAGGAGIGGGGGGNNAAGGASGDIAIVPPPDADVTSVHGQGAPASAVAADIGGGGGDVGAGSSTGVNPAATVIPWTLTAQVIGTGGSISPTGSVTVYPHANQPFTVTAATNYTIASIVVDANETGEYTVTPVAPGQTSFVLTDVTADHTVTVTFAADYSISLSETAHSFPDATYGYGAQTPVTFTVTNTGPEPAGALSVDVNPSDFTVTQTNPSSLDTADDTATFTVVPKTGLSAGGHTATVTVGPAAGNTNLAAADSQTFDVTFTVDPASITVTAENAWKYFGDPDPALTWHSNDLVNGDTTSSFTGSLKYTGTAVGSHPITVGSLKNSNYKIQTFVQATMKILPALPVPVRNWADADKVAKVTNAVNALPAKERAQLPQSLKDKLAKAQTQAGRVNHIDGANTITGSLPWNIRLVVTPIAASDPRYTNFVDALTGKQLVALFDIKLINTLTGATYEPPAGTVLTVTLGKLSLEGVTGIAVDHQLAAGALEQLAASVHGDAVTFQASSFSLYGVVADSNQYSIPAGLAAAPSGGAGGLALWLALLVGLCLAGAALLAARRLLITARPRTAGRHASAVG